MSCIIENNYIDSRTEILEGQIIEYITYDKYNRIANIQKFL